MKCLKEKCYYYSHDNDVEICDLVLDEFITDDSCIGYKQIQKEIDIALQDMASANRKYQKLLRLQERIKKE